jgi:hypothetical protein
MQRWFLLIAITALLPAATGQGGVLRRDPHAGYVYPAGGRVGTTVTVTIGGQNLRAAQDCRITGGRVQARILRWIPPPRRLDRPQAQELRRRLAELRDARLGQTGVAPVPLPGVKRARAGKQQEPVELPDHPLLQDLESKSLEELLEVARYFFQRRNPLQRKRSIEESLQVELTIAPDATPGLRDLRVLTPAGISKPLRFQVGTLPEVLEREAPLPPGPPVEVPFVGNGQIMPRDADTFRFRASAGQHLVLRARARTFVPFQADSVPGWMQTTLAVLDQEGRELAYADEFRFDPDPVLTFEVPRTGVYQVEVRDAIARGRADFVYRISVGELPFVTGIFPLGGTVGQPQEVAVTGWNLPLQHLALDTAPDAPREVALTGAVANPVTYDLSALPATPEPAAGEAGEPPILALPLLVDGCISSPGERDRLRFRGKRGDQVVIEVRARELGSPLDSVVRLYDGFDRILAWNDDHMVEGLGVRGLGLQTHQADSYLQATLPRRGLYTVEIADVRQHAGADHAYRLRVGPPCPDVKLLATPSNLNVPAGRAMPLTVYAIRRDGFDGAIDLHLDGDDRGCRLDGACIPRGRDLVHLTLTAPPDPAAPVFPLHLVGRIQVDGQIVERPVQPADNLQQAFLWRHLVPAEELVVAVIGSGRFAFRVEAIDRGPVELEPGQTTTVRFRAPPRLPLDRIRLQPAVAPAGVSLGALERSRRGFTMEIVAADTLDTGTPLDNLIIEIQARPRARGDQAKRPQAPRWMAAGTLPAMPLRASR